eukprot:115991_1
MPATPTLLYTLLDTKDPRWSNGRSTPKYPCLLCKTEVAKNPRDCRSHFEKCKSIPIDRQEEIMGWIVSSKREPKTEPRTIYINASLTPSKSIAKSVSNLNIDANTNNNKSNKNNNKSNKKTSNKNNNKSNKNNNKISTFSQSLEPPNKKRKFNTLYEHFHRSM